METSLKDFRADYPYFGYGYFNSVDEAIPPVGLTFTTFRLMVILGSYFFLFYIFTIALTYKPQLLERWRWFQLTAMISVPFMWVCSEAGWAIAEVGPSALDHPGPASHVRGNLRHTGIIGGDHILDVRRSIHHPSCGRGKHYVPLCEQRNQD